MEGYAVTKLFCIITIRLPLVQAVMYTFFQFVKVGSRSRTEVRKGLKKLNKKRGWTGKNVLL